MALAKTDWLGSAPNDTLSTERQNHVYSFVRWLSRSSISWNLFCFFWGGGGGFKTTLDERNVDAYLVSCSVFGPQIGEVVVSRWHGKRCRETEKSRLWPAKVMNTPANLSAQVRRSTCDRTFLFKLLWWRTVTYKKKPTALLQQGTSHLSDLSSASWCPWWGRQTSPEQPGRNPEAPAEGTHSYLCRRAGI